METLAFFLVLCTVCSQFINCQNFSRDTRIIPPIPVGLSRTSLMKIEAQVVNQAIENAKTPNPPSVECGRPNLPNMRDRIVGGTEASANEFPWQVSLLMVAGESYFACGGSLIDNDWVLTAAHCVEGASSIYVYLGAHDLSADEEPNRQIHTTDLYYIHPDWNHLNLAGDIALIQLLQSVTYTDYIRPICLAGKNDSDHVNDTVVLTGWGRYTDANSNLSPVLLKTKSTVISREQCSQVYGVITDKIICTDGSEGHGTCNGDSGGPLNYFEADGRYTQIGIVSFGSDEGCEKGYPDAFTRVSSYLDWIADIMENATVVDTTVSPVTQSTSKKTSKPSSTVSFQSSTSYVLLSMCIAMFI